MEPKALKEFIGKDVVLDTKGPLVFLGRLVEVDEHLFTLEEADVHDSSERQGTKEVYILEARKHGIKKNRRRVLVRAREVVSISLLEDVIEY
jgi:small nuclear ribonucleoprotein (snRNP)-like protein